MAALTGKLEEEAWNRVLTGPRRQRTTAEAVRFWKNLSGWGRARHSIRAPGAIDPQPPVYIYHLNRTARPIPDVAVKILTGRTTLPETTGHPCSLVVTSTPRAKDMNSCGFIAVSSQASPETLKTTPADPIWPLRPVAPSRPRVYPPGRAARQQPRSLSAVSKTDRAGSQTRRGEADAAVFPPFRVLSTKSNPRPANDLQTKYKHFADSSNSRLPFDVVRI